MAKNGKVAKPFGGAVSRYAEKDAPKAVRKALAGAGHDDILDPHYPYAERMDEKEYEHAYKACQLELVKLQTFGMSEIEAEEVIIQGFLK